MNTYTYWENAPGQERPAYIGYCLDTITARSNHIHLHPGNIHEHVKDLHPEWDTIECLAHKADYLRTCILQENGGLWIDCDMIMTAEPVEVESALASGSDYVCTFNRFNQPAISYIASQKGGTVITNWRKDIEDYLDSGKTVFNWTQIGSDLVAKSLATVNWTKLASERVLPIPFTDWPVLLTEADWTPPEDTLCIALYNSLLPKEIKECDDILSRDLLLSKLLRAYL